MTKADIFSFFKVVLVVLGLSFLFDKIVYYSLNRISDKVYNGQGVGKLNQFLKLKNSLDLVVFGSSRANRHFVITELSDNGFNIGVDGRKIAYPATLIKLLPVHKKQTVIFNIDMSYMIDSTYVGQDVDALMPFYNRNLIITKSINHLNQNNPFQKIYSTIGYNGYVVSILYNFIFPKYDYKNYDGYDPNFISTDQQNNLKKLIAKSKNKAFSKNIIINKVTKDSFAEISKFCRDNGKQLVFVASPVYNDINKQDNLMIEYFMKKNGYNYLDYTDYFLTQNKLEYWKDLEHLSDAGARLFSAQLASDLSLKVKK